MRHTFRCPIRRADLHPGGTVNNVLYADYLQEARRDLFRELELWQGAPPRVTHLMIEYLVPLTLTPRQVDVSTWVTEAAETRLAIEHELSSSAEDGSTRRHARATTTLAPSDEDADADGQTLTAAEQQRLRTYAEPPSPDQRAVVSSTQPMTSGHRRQPIPLRASDVDLSGLVSPTRQLEFVMDASTDLAVEVFEQARVNGTVDIVIVRTDVDFLEPVVLGPQTYDLSTRIARIGTTSLTFDSEIRAGERVLTRSRVVKVFVGEDDRPTPIHPKHREGFERRLAT